jgi:heptosyltransferase-1
LKILIVKLSSLGDVVHAMAAVQDILQAYPQAQIDWVVERGFAALVQRCAGVRRVVPCELRRWRKAPLSAPSRVAWQVFKADLQSEAYDAVIDLQGLTKSALISWLARLAPGGSRYALANQTDGSSYEAPTRWVANVLVLVQPHIHAVARSRELCARALGYRVPDHQSFGLLAHVNQAQAAINNIAFEAGQEVFHSSAGAKGVVALVHGTSRADKEWPLAHWQALGRRLIEAGYTLALPHGSDAEEQVARQIAAPLVHARIWPRLGLDLLCDALGGCAGVVGVDSGLSHIAVALDLPHVQIYNFDTAWRTGPQVLGASSAALRQCSVFARPTPSVEAVWQAWLDVSRIERMA